MVDKEKAGRERFEKALSIYEEELMKDFPPENGDVSWSEQHEAEMKKLIRRSQKLNWEKFNWKSLNRIGKGAAVIAIVILTIIGISNPLVSVDEFRSEFYEISYPGRPEIVWYKFPLEDSMRAPRKIETEYMLSYIPEGFYLVETNIEKEWRHFLYENDAGEKLCYEQNKLSHGVGLDTTRVQIEVLQIRDVKVVFAKSESGISMYWGHYGYSFRLRIPPTFTKEECLKLYESIVKVKE